jgi:hypothetical protein
MRAAHRQKHPSKSSALRSQQILGGEIRPEDADGKSGLYVHEYDEHPSPQAELARLAKLVK